MFPENVTVLEVAAPGGLDRHGEPTSVTVTWTGRVRAYLHAPRMARQDDGRGVDARPVRLTFHGSAPSALLDALTAGTDAAACEVTVVDDAGTEEIFTAKGLTRYQAGTLADSVRVELRKGRVQ
jgi:hypothetical protein